MKAVIVFLFGCVHIAASTSLLAQSTAAVLAGRWPAELTLQGGAALLDGKLFLTATGPDGLRLVAYRTATDSLHLGGQKPISAPPITQPGAMALFNHWLFVGANNPKTKRNGRLLVLDVSHAQAMQQPPVFALDRKGAKTFSTITAVAVVQNTDHLIVALASENCTTIEFFLSNGLNPSAPGFELKRWCQWDERTAERKGWSDPHWNNYLTIALSKKDGEIRLLGLGRDPKGKAVLDTYQLLPKNDIFTLVNKTASRQADIANINEPMQAFGIVNDPSGQSTVLWARTVGHVVRFSANR